MKYFQVLFVIFCITTSSQVLSDTTNDNNSNDNKAFIITTTIEPSSQESWEVTDNSNSGGDARDFGVPDPSDPLPSNAPPKISTDPLINSSDVSSPPPSPVVTIDKDESEDLANYKPLSPEIYSFHIESNIKYRYSRTYITSRVVNRDAKKSSEVRFRVVLPETAFISKFLMEIDGKTYEAYVKEKEEAKRVYNQAQSQGQSAGLVELNTRNTNVFDVNVNIQAKSKVNFNLTYEELLSRRLGKYEQSINISPEQITNVKDFQILVTIEESQNITRLFVPNLRNDVDAVPDEEGNNKDAVIERPSGNKAKITWKPSEQAQSQLDKQKLTGKFIVQYDISRELDAGEILVMNGYFVHFFAPENLKPLRKHVVFILDTSGSMWGRRIEQLKEAMTKILADLTSDDFFNIVTFASDVVLWSPEDKTPISPNSHWSPPGEIVPKLVVDASRRQPYQASKENIEKAQLFINSLVASGGTNIHDSIVEALNLTNAIKQARDGIPISTTPSTTTVSTTTPKLTTKPLTGSTPSFLPSTVPVENSGEIGTTSVSEAPSSTTTPASTTTTTIPSTTTTSKPITILPPNVESLIIFLTDGEPTVGVTNPTSIQTLIKTANANSSIPIFSLGFGDGADFPFLRKLSLQNNGFARKIYADSDAAIQLKGFYNEIASPLLSNVTFNYTSPEYSIENVTLTKYPTIFGGTEIVVAGKIIPKPENSTEEKPKIVVGDNPAISTRTEENTEIIDDDTLVVPTDKHYFDVEISGSGRDGLVHFNNPEIFSSPIPWGIPVTVPFPPRPTLPPTQEDLFLERLWAYLTIKQLIEKDLAQDPVSNEIEDEVIAPSPSTTPSQVISTTIAPGYNGTSVSNKTTPTVPETPRQRALRLALKFGFVTSLTSIVVVKPNSTDVTDSVPSDPQTQDVSSGNFAALSLNKISYSTGNRISIVPLTAFQPLSLHHQAYSPNRIVGFGQAGMPGFGPPAPPPLFTTTAGRPVYIPSTTTHYQPSTVVQIQPSVATSEAALSSKEPSLEVGESDEDIVEEYLTTVSSSHGSASSSEEDDSYTTTGAASVPTSASPVPSYSLSDISWYTGSNGITVNRTEYVIAETVLAANTSSSKCVRNLNNNPEVGVCTHLRDCIQSNFKDDFSVYVESYFCPIESSDQNIFYAGACCVSQQPQSSSTNKRNAFRSDSIEDLSFS